MIPYTILHNKKKIPHDHDILLYDRDISYSQLSTVLHEAQAGYKPLTAYGTNQCSFPSEVIHRSFIKLEGSNRPQTQDLKSE